MGEVKWKLAKGQTWRKKLTQAHPNHGKVVRVPPAMQARFGKGTMLIPRPLDIDAIIRGVRRGKLITYSQIRERLARAAKADAACPLTTGIFIRIVAEAAEEDRMAGRKRVTPYWRAIRDNGELNEKYPGGVWEQAERLREEGFTIASAGRSKRLRVADHEKYAAQSRG